MSENINYRTKSTEKDIKSVVEIVESTGFFYEHEIDIAKELIVENLEKGEEKSGYSFLFMEESDKVIGFSCYGEIGCTKNRYDLYWIVVDERYRNKGYGSILIDETEQRIKDKKGKIVYVETSSKEKYNSTRNFYLKNEYVLEAEIQDFYDDGDNKIIFSKK